jgi:hypothetical protein
VLVTGGEGTQAVEDYLVPQGATFTSDVQGTTPVDEGAVKPQERKPLPVRSHAAHKHADAAAPAPAGSAAAHAGRRNASQTPQEEGNQQRYVCRKTHRGKRHDRAVGRIK